MTNKEINSHIKVLRGAIIIRNRKISGAHNGSGYPMERYNSDYYDELNAKDESVKIDRKYDWNSSRQS